MSVLRPRTRKILITSPYFPPHLGGVELVAAHEATRFAKLGWTVTVVTSDRGSRPGIDAVNGVRVHRVPAIDLVPRRFGVPIPLFSPTLWRVLRQEVAACDAVHAHGAVYLLSLLVALAARRQRKPLLVTEHVGKVPYGSGFVRVIQWLAFQTVGRITLASARRVLVLNSHVRGQMSALTSAPIGIVKNGVDCQLFRPALEGEREHVRKVFGIPMGRPAVLYVGRFASKKRVDVLREALPDGFFLVLAGMGDALLPPAKVGRELVLPPLTQLELAGIYRACDVLALPSTGEGFPAVLQEALASELPVIISDEPVLRELLPSGVCFASPDPEAFEDAIRRVVARSERSRDTRHAMREWVSSSFPMDAATSVVRAEIEMCIS